MTLIKHALPPTPPMSEPSECEDEPAVVASKTPKPRKGATAPIWWSNAIFFISMHILALFGALKLSPWWQLDKRTAWMCFISWQAATYGITMGYHRLWSHRAFAARMPLRILLAAMGCLGFQGSIKWWVLRHRLHHRFTDSEDDPYDATKGLLWSHMGWIFWKPNYPRLPLIDRKDLDADPVVRFQHKYYIPLTLFLGLVLPTLVGATYGDAMGGYIWGGVVARLLIWHFTFCINSLAHYLGDQPYSEDVTARGNLLLAIFTGGEASHNYHHGFPTDYRNGPHKWDWDPTKHLIWLCHRYTPWVPTLKWTSPEEIDKARARVLKARAERLSPSAVDGARGARLPIWRRAELKARVEALTQDRMASGSLKRPLVVVVDGYACELSTYAAKHPGGVAILRSHSVRDEGNAVLDASDAFNGGVNNHGSVARDLMLSLRIAQILD